MRCRCRWALIVTVLMAAAWCAPRLGGAPAAPRVDWQYQYIAEKTQASYDLRFRVAPKGAAEGIAVRLFIGEGGRNGAFFELGPQGAFHGAVRDGEEVRGKADDSTPLHTLTGQEIVFEQRLHRWALCAGGRLLAGGDEFFGERRPIGFGVVGGDAAIADFRYQAVPDVFFTDTFMRTGDDPTSWSELAGKWTLKTISNPLLSANAFTYSAAGAAVNPDVVERCSTSDSGFLATVHGKTGAIELPMAYGGPQDYTLFRWTAPAEKANARKQWVRVLNGRETLLAESPGGYVPGQSYSIGVSATAEGVVLTLDSAPLFTVAASSLPAGPISPHLAGASVVGEWFWSDIRYSVAARPARRGAVGVYLCHRGPQDYCLFRWTSADSPRPVRQIIRRSSGKDTLLAESSGGYLPEQWYTITSTVGSGWMEVALDGHPVLRAHDRGLSYGRVGLYVEGDQPASFDDVTVENHRAVLMDFARARPGAYLVTGGDWLQVAPDSNRELWPGGMAVQAPESARLLFGSARWRNYGLSAGLGPWEKGAMGLCFRYQDELNYYLGRIRKDAQPVVELVRRVDGQEELLGSSPLVPPLAGRRLSVCTEGDAMVLAVDGMPMVRAADSAFLTGRVGLYAQGLDSGVFSDVTCEFLPAPKPINSTHEAFSGEESMQVWSGAMSDWEKKSCARPDGQPPVEIAWHRSDFHGDVTIEARLDNPPAAGAEIGLAVNGNGTDLKEGFCARLMRRSGAEKGCEVELLASGKAVGAAPLPWESGPMILGLARSGDLITLRVHGDSLLSCRDTAGAAGRRIGWYALKAPVKTADIDIYTDNLVDYMFNSAPTDWRIASGIWEVTNKWQCDPRWSFFSGRTDPNVLRGDQVAALWNKRPIRGDFTIEFYVGNKMDSARGGSYQYAQDMNITVCADGNDLTSGYSFLFGGFDNTFTGIYRGAQRWGVPENPVFIERSGNLHRRWYHIAVRRKGNTFEMRVDDRLVISREDPQPLPGAQWAIWTRNNGLMFARVRVIAEGIGQRESPDLAHPAVAQSVYSNN